MEALESHICLEQVPASGEFGKSYAEFCSMGHLLLKFSRDLQQNRCLCNVMGFPLSKRMDGSCCDYRLMEGKVSNETCKGGS